jgi:hypothetical protein
MLLFEFDTWKFNLKYFLRVDLVLELTEISLLFLVKQNLG